MNTLTVNRNTLPVVEAELHLPYTHGARLMYLRVSAVDDREGFELTLGEIELPLLKDIQSLDGQRLHVRLDGEAYHDDTLGTDVIGMMNNDLSEWSCGMEGVSDGELKIDFHHLEGDMYRCVAEFAWQYEEDDEPPEEEEIVFEDEEEDANDRESEEPEDVIGSADFLVRVDEIDPHAEID